MSPLAAVLYTVGWVAVYFLASRFGLFREAWILQLLFFLIPGVLGTVLFSQSRPRHKIPSTRDFGIVLGWTLLLSLLLDFSSAGLNRLFPMPEAIQRFLYQSIPRPFLPWENPQLLLFVCIIPAVAEEILFRGFLLSQLSRAFNRWIAIGLTSLVFAAAHMNPWQFPLFLILGFFLGWCQARRGISLLPMGAHAFNNLIALILAGAAY